MQPLLHYARAERYCAAVPVALWETAYEQARKAVAGTHFTPVCGGVRNGSGRSKESGAVVDNTANHRPDCFAGVAALTWPNVRTGIADMGFVQGHKDQIPGRLAAPEDTRIRTNADSRRHRKERATDHCRRS